MKKILFRFVALVLVFAMAMSVASCRNGKKKNAEIINEDDPWFDSEVTKVDLGLDTSRMLGGYLINMAGADEKNIVIVASGSYRADDGSDDYDKAENFVLVSVFDQATKQVKKIDLSNEFTATDFINDTSYKDGILSLTVNHYDPKTFNSNLLLTEIDLDSGKILNSKGTTDFTYSRRFKLGEFLIGAYLFIDNNNIGRCKLYVQSPGEDKHTTIELKEAGVNYQDIPFIVPINESKVLVCAVTEKDNRFYEVDLNESIVKALDAKDYEWLDLDALGDINNVYAGADGKSYFTTSNGISKIDLEKKTIETFLDYNWTVTNRDLLEYMEIVSCDGNSAVVAGQKSLNYGMALNPAKDENEYYVVSFKKAEKNPNAGKTVLTLYEAEDFASDKVNEAIQLFNSSNSSYYIKVTDKYKEDQSGLSNARSEDEYDLARLNMNSDMGNQLTMDIINGTGPDIFISTSDIGALNSSYYLADLTPYFNDLDSSKYFTNIVEASKYDGKLYQMPICFRLYGIMTEAKYSGTSGVGFTIDEYEEFLNGPLNGTDALYKSQVYYFTDLFTAMSDDFIKNGKADFTCPEFAELAFFVKENVPEKTAVYDFDSEEPTEQRAALAGTCYGIGDCFREQYRYNGNFALLGLPSSDGRGPMFEAYTSVAVSSQSTNVDACVEFIRILLSDEIQKGMAEQEHLVLNRNAFREVGMEAAEYLNGPGGNWIFGYDVAISNRPMTFSEKTVNDFEKIIDSCSRIYSEDADISKILIEEMPAYFTGQKDLDSVIAIVQDRVQKVLDERG
ncbi:ABC-type glycerol-3-phosphate transport system substrate-binding protein [Ruminococcaceae bacterium R-25]|nr:ABC-type glycerol-3-phosphate transport system substrate-binding protein [Ruminococcaceae bacterium R-25]SUQ11746.1 ABC-type glycerol-3-phosphate transport system, substrate-binding protein [Oscillospiraceae bacterium]